MKKGITFSLCFLVLLSCSSDDDSNTKIGLLSPPDWLIGTWINESNTELIYKYIISNDNVVLEYLDGSIYDYSDIIEGNNAIFNEDVSVNAYSFFINNNTSISIAVLFDKTLNDKIYSIQSDSYLFGTDGSSFLKQ